MLSLWTFSQGSKDLKQPTVKLIREPGLSGDALDLLKLFVQNGLRKSQNPFSGSHDAVIRVGDALRDPIERRDRAGKVDCHSGIRKRADHGNRICCIHNMGTRRMHSNRTGNSRNRNIRTDSPSPTTTESRSRR
jgi:hypothetical protein